MMITNHDRALWAFAGLLAYAKGKEGHLPADTLYDDTETVLSDFLGDLLHLADRDAIDFRRCLERARMHYEEEKAEETACHSRRDTVRARAQDLIAAIEGMTDQFDEEVRALQQALDEAE
jgi:hypothetical protein